MILYARNIFIMNIKKIFSYQENLKINFEKYEYFI